MPNYQLTLNIKPADLNTIIEARESIIVAKSRPSSSPTAAWLAIQPFETNVVRWDESYALYASGRNGQIEWTAATPYPSQPGVCYPLTGSGAFENPVTCPVQMPLTDYGVVNRVEASPSLTFGQMQSAVVNGTALQPAAVSAEVIPLNQQGVFQPMLTVWVWLQSDLTSGTRLDVGQAISKPAIVTYGPASMSQALVYDSSQGMFVPTT
jgi:hypothetical protein